MKIEIFPDSDAGGSAGAGKLSRTVLRDLRDE
jgi:hypothetical protein